MNPQNCSLKGMLRSRYATRQRQAFALIESELASIQVQLKCLDREVEGLERLKYKNGSRKLVDRVVELRNENHELRIECQLLSLAVKPPGKSIANASPPELNRSRSGKSFEKLGFGLRPGMENTAQILQIIPPAPANHRQGQQQFISSPSTMALTRNSIPATTGSYVDSTTYVMENGLQMPIEIPQKNDIANYRRGSEPVSGVSASETKKTIWSCPHCKFNNSNALSQCELCNWPDNDR